jgi:hypothetical protein
LEKETIDGSELMAIVRHADGGAAGRPGLAAGMAPPADLLS